MIILDAGVLDYNRLWITNSMRGSIKSELTVKVLYEGVHSGDASGIIPSSFRILRKLLDRIENSDNGEIIKEF